MLGVLTQGQRVEIPFSMQPSMLSRQQEYDGVSDVARMYSVRAVPAFVFFDDGAAVRSRLWCLDCITDYAFLHRPHCVVLAHAARDLITVQFCIDCKRRVGQTAELAFIFVRCLY